MRYLAILTLILALCGCKAPASTPSQSCVEVITHLDMRVQAITQRISLQKERIKRLPFHKRKAVFPELRQVGVEALDYLDEAEQKVKQSCSGDEKGNALYLVNNARDMYRFLLEGLKDQ